MRGVKKVSTSRKTWALLGLAAGAFVGVCLGLEVLLGLTHGGWTVQSEKETGFIRHRVLHHHHKPGASLNVSTPEFKVEVRFNSLGLRGGEYPLKKGAGERRVLLLGDSMVESLQVWENETFASLLEAALNSQRSEGPRWRVINGGVSGYSPLLQYLFLKHFGSSVDPDLVVLSFFPNDFAEDIEYSKRLLKDPAGKPAACPPEDAGAFERTGGIVWRSHLLSLVAHRLTLLRHRYFHGDEAGFLFLKASWDDATRNLWDRTTGRYLLDINDLLKSRDIPWVLVYMPVDAELGGRISPGNRFYFAKTPSPRGRAMLAGFCERAGIACLDLTAALAALKSGLYFPHDGHLTPKGHSAVARAIFGYLMEKKIGGPPRG